MIGVTVDYNGNTLLMSLPTDELYDHLGSIGIPLFQKKTATYPC